MRLIDADQLTKHAQIKRVRVLDNLEVTEKTIDMSYIDNAPTVDAVPVVHARWIYSGAVDEDGNCESNCSACGAGDKHRPDLKDAVPYCWNCGARMDEKEDTK